MKRTKFIPLCAVLLAALTALTGCGGTTIYANYKDLEDLNLIRTVGVDGTENGVAVTVSTGTGAESGEPHVYTHEAQTVYGALDWLKNSPVGRETDFSHTENLIIGGDSADGVFNECIDYILRSVDLRLDSRLFIARNGTAEELITGCAGRDTSASDMLKVLTNDIAMNGEGYVFTCREIASSLENRGCGLVCAVEAQDTADRSASAPEKMITARGFAVIQDGKVASYVEPEDAMGTCLLLNKVKSGIVCVENKAGETVTLELSRAKSRLEPVYSGDGTLRSVTVRVEADANIMEVSAKSRETVYYRDGAAQAFAKDIEEKTAKALRKARETGIDYLDLEGRLRMKDPVLFDRTSDRRERDSADAISNDVLLYIVATCKVGRTYGIDTPIETGGR